MPLLLPDGTDLQHYRVLARSLAGLHVHKYPKLGQITSKKLMQEIARTVRKNEKQLVDLLPVL